MSHEPLHGCLERKYPFFGLPELHEPVRIDFIEFVVRHVLLLHHELHLRQFRQNLVVGDLSHLHHLLVERLVVGFDALIHVVLDEACQPLIGCLNRALEAIEFASVVIERVLEFPDAVQFALAVCIVGLLLLSQGCHAFKVVKVHLLGELVRVHDRVLNPELCLQQVVFQPYQLLRIHYFDMLPITEFGSHCD